MIVGGADIGRYDRAKSLLRPDDFGIYCDCGLRHRSGLGLAPGLIVGDFDSFPRPEGLAETIALPREKDDTDTFFAAKEAVRRGFQEFLLLGMTGGRMDHTLGNLSLLLWLHGQGKDAVLLDDWSLMSIVSGRPETVEDSFPFFSLLNISGTARGVRITGAKYPLRDTEIPCDYAYGISNEVLPGQRAEISVREGCLLLIRVYENPQPAPA